MRQKELVLGVTASIAIYKAMDLIRRLKEKGFNITVIMTNEARKFIRPLSFQAISENKVYYHMFCPAEGFSLKHVSLAKKAKLILIYPATANFIGKLASGICEDLLSCTIISSKAEVFICPAMDEDMYRNKIVQANINKLKELGYKFIGPVKGRLASGRIGIGHIAPVGEVIKVVLREMK